MKKKLPVKILLYLLVLLFCCGHAVQAQSPAVFIVINSQTKLPVSGAFLHDSAYAFTVVADDNGTISTKKMPGGSRKLFVSALGFKTTMLTRAQSNDETLVSLEPKVASLSEVMVKATTNGGVFKTISDLDIHLRPINNSQEVLRIVPGLFIGQHAGGGKAEQIFLRGFDIDHGTDINISVDGMPVNMVSHAHGQGYADLHFLIPELIDKVNFNKGPYFADKGNFTTAGFVEFKTKDVLEKNFIKAEAGQFGTYRGIAGLNLLQSGKDRVKQNLYVAAEGSYTRGFFEIPQNFSRYNGLLKYNSNLNNRSTITATLSSFSSKWQASGQVPLRAVNNGLIGYYGAIDDTEGGQTSRYNASFAWKHRLKNGGHYSSHLYYSRYDFELYSNFTFFREDSTNGDQIRQKEKRNIWGYQSSYAKKFNFAGLKTETKIGVQLRYDMVNNIELSRTKDRLTTINPLMRGDVAEFNGGIYWQQTMFPSSKWELIPSVRADQFSNKYEDGLTGQNKSSSTVLLSPKLNITYQLNKNVQFYFYNGKGFHSNDTRVAVQQDGKKVVPPAFGSDMGAIFKPGKKLLVQAALWHLWLDQEFVYVGDEGVVEPGGRSRRFGFDLSTRYELIKNLFADFDLSISKGRALGVDKRESYLPLSPGFTSVGGLTYRKRTGLNGSLRYRYMFDRPANENNSVIAEGYFIADAAINYAHQTWELGLAIQNIFDSKWRETQFNTESRLQNEPAPISEIHFTPGTPFFGRLSLTKTF